MSHEVFISNRHACRSSSSGCQVMQVVKSIDGAITGEQASLNLSRASAAQTDLYHGTTSGVFYIPY